MKQVPVFKALKPCLRLSRLSAAAVTRLGTFAFRIKLLSQEFPSSLSSRTKPPAPPESWLRCLRSFGDLDDTGTCLLLWHVLRSLKGPSVGQRCALSLQGLGLALLWPGSPPLSSNRAVAGHLVTMAPCPSVPLPPSYFIFLEHCPPPPCWECFMSVITYICSSSSTDPRLPGGKGSVVLVAVTPLSPERSLAQTTFVGR